MAQAIRQASVALPVGDADEPAGPASGPEVAGDGPVADLQRLIEARMQPLVAQPEPFFQQVGVVEALIRRTSLLAGWAILGGGFLAAGLFLR